MNIRSTLLVSSAVFALALGAQAGNEAADRCFEAARQDDPQQVVVECSKAVKIDPTDTRAREALEAAKNQIARIDPKDHPAKRHQD